MGLQDPVGGRRDREFKEPGQVPAHAYTRTLTHTLGLDLQAMILLNTPKRKGCVSDSKGQGSLTTSQSF